jgi:hypothetical protein
MKCVCPMGGDRTCPDNCLLAKWWQLSPAERTEQYRKPMAEKLYSQGYTMEAIATQLGVGTKTISRDLENFVIVTKSKPAKTARNPKGAGRPKGKKSKRKAKAVSPPPHPDDPIQEPCEDCKTPEEQWRYSVGFFAGETISMPAYWTRQFGDWKKFEVTSDLVTLVKQASEVWTQLASEVSLQKRDAMSEKTFTRLTDLKPDLDVKYQDRSYFRGLIGEFADRLIEVDIDLARKLLRIIVNARADANSRDYLAQLLSVGIGCVEDHQAHGGTAQ